MWVTFLCNESVECLSFKVARLEHVGLLHPDLHFDGSGRAEHQARSAGSPSRCSPPCRHMHARTDTLSGPWIDDVCVCVCVCVCVQSLGRCGHG